MTDYTLEIEFDVNQVTRSLQYKFTSPEGSPEIPEGALAGTYHFSAGDTLGFKLTATGKATDEIGVSVTDCSIISIGTSSVGKFDLSPFSKESAASKVDHWGPPSISETEPDRMKVIIKADMTLPIVAENGQWKISGYLSAGLRIAGKTYNRLFYFDPEGSTGNGGGHSFP
jgi:hypothetical protein